jgi:hypothetical protein
MAIAGLICSIVGTSLAIWQYRAITSGVNAFKEEIEKIDTTRSGEQTNDNMQNDTDSLEQHQ